MSCQPQYSDYTVKWVTLPWERKQAYTLRQKVFCQEQRIFIGDDLDIIDDHAQLLVVVGSYGGWHEQVVGTVRIHQEQPGEWLGSRLAVDPDFRRQGQLGAMLIKLAVSSACALGCKRFYAHVQQQNECLFQRLHWHTLQQEVLRERAHVFMRAELEHYPPCADPQSGYVVRGRLSRSNNDLSPAWVSDCVVESEVVHASI